jgi:light-regulated signal transduction histidine kinase (bacteriophytochrome)
MESFCHSVSHDLRAPLRHINAYSAIVSEEFASKLSEEGQGYLQRIALASRRMGELIDDLLGLSRLSRAELQCVEVDLSQLCREIATELAEREPMRQVRFIIASGIRGTGDPQLLRLLLYNLLDNAWKYTAQTAEPQIEVGVEQQQGETIYLVKDNGAGFDMAHAEKLFTPFQRLHREDEFSGIGIGLATVQRIVERHGGRVWGEGYPQGGATFRFTLGMKGERNVVIGG